MIRSVQDKILCLIGFFGAIRPKPEPGKPGHILVY